MHSLSGRNLALHDTIWAMNVLYVYQVSELNGALADYETRYQKIISKKP